MAKATLKKENIQLKFYLTVSEVELIIILMGNMEAYRKTWCWTSSYYMLISRKEEIDSVISKRYLKGNPHSSTLHSTRPHLLQ